MFSGKYIFEFQQYWLLYYADILMVCDKKKISLFLYENIKFSKPYSLYSEKTPSTKLPKIMYHLS